MSNSKKRIAIFGVKYFPSKGGTSRVVEHLLWELKDEYDFTIYCYRNSRAANHMPGVQTIELSAIPIKGLGVWLYYLRCCLHLLFKGRYDLVHVHKTDGAFFLPILSLKFKTISTSHALPYLNAKWSYFGKLYFRLAEWIFMHFGNSRTAVSKTQAAYYQKTHQRPISYIPNGVLPGSAPDLGLAQPILRKHEVADRYLFFAARRLIPLKGCHHLIKALKQINYKGCLLIAADITQMPQYTRQIEQMAAGLNVVFVGYIADQELLKSLIATASLFIFPSELEGMSMMLLETGSLGTPMICSDIPQNTSVFTEKEVLYFTSQDHRDLADKLNWAMAHPEAMQQLATQAKQKIDAEYLFARVARQYAALYDELLLSTIPESSTARQQV